MQKHCGPSAQVLFDHAAPAAFSVATIPIAMEEPPPGPDATDGTDNRTSPLPASPTLEAFRLRNLDSGETSWIEKSDEPGRQLRAQSSARASEHRVAREQIRRRSGSGMQKRAQSDELVQKQSVALRSADHVRVTAHKKREREFSNLYRWQEIRAHNGAIRVLRFNCNGKLLASAGMDGIIKIWDVDARCEDKLDLPSPRGDLQQYQRRYLRNSKASVTLEGHDAEVIDMAWSKNNFLVSGGMDKTIRLWHPTTKEWLRKFVHSDFVTAVAFHPDDEQICISGSSDGSLRMWHMKEEKLLSQTDIDDLITACVITPDGTTVLVGTLHGRCKFFGLFDEIQGEWQFNHTTQLDVRSRRARNGYGKKIAGFCFRPSGEEVLVSSNDSRIRLYRMDDKAVLSKFMGHFNEESQLNASFSPCGRYVLSGSENRTVCIWEVQNAPGLVAKRRAGSSVDGGRRGASSESRQDNRFKNLSVETFSPHDNGHVTAAVFAPKKARTPKSVKHASPAGPSGNATGLVIVTASEDGEIRVFGCG